MKLSEIAIRPEQVSRGYKHKQLDVESGELIGTYENFPIWKFKSKSSPQIVYGIKIDDTIVAEMFGVYTTLLGKSRFAIQRVWTAPQYRMQGLMTILYVGLAKKFNISLMSDVEHTPVTKRIWAKLIQELPVNVFNTKTNELHPVTPELYQQVYSPEGKNYVLMLEKLFFPGISGVEMGILTEYINYTHPENIGKYE